MSYETWKAKYYPTNASEFSGLAHRSLGVQLRATKHALRKWRGLRDSAMAAHGVEFVAQKAIGSMHDDTARLYVDASSCALCQLCVDEDESVQCRRCPITAINGRTCNTEYRTFSSRVDVEPMIALLEETKRHLKLAATAAPAQVVHYNVDALRWSYHLQSDGTYRISTAPSGEVSATTAPPGAVVADNVQNVDDAALMAFAPQLLSLLCKASSALATGEDSKELQKTIADALIGFANGKV